MNLSIQLDQKAKRLAKQYLFSEKELISVLAEMDEKKIFLSLGFTGVFNYCQIALHFSESQAGYFSSIVRKARTIPEIKKAIENGEVSVSQMRRVLPVITPENKDIWIQKTAELPQKQLQKEVAAQNPQYVQEKIKPVSENRHLLKLGVSDKLLEKWERAKAILSKRQGKVLCLEETLEGILEVFLQKEDPIEKAKRAAVKETKASTAPVQTPVQEDGKFVRKPIPASVVHQVNLRDQGKCTVEGCTNQIFTELHHVKPVCQGGEHSLRNILTICSAHHALIHGRKLFPCMNSPE